MSTYKGHTLVEGIRYEGDPVYKDSTGYAVLRDSEFLVAIPEDHLVDLLSAEEQFFGEEFTDSRWEIERDLRTSGRTNKDLWPKAGE
jgi:hypothetical protein